MPESPIIHKHTSSAGGALVNANRDDPVKEEILRPMFGDEWPRRRTFPNTVVDEGETLVFDGLSFTLIDLRAEVLRNG